jgi:four helix bundle protein
MEMENLIDRTKNFCVRIIKMMEHLPETKSSKVITAQILRSDTSIGANYRAARLAKSHRDFINKLKILEEEADETIFWLELMEECKICQPQKLQDLKREAEELLAIFIASIKTAKARTKH